MPKLKESEFKTLCAEVFPDPLLYQDASPIRVKRSFGRSGTIPRRFCSDPHKRFTAELIGKKTNLQKVKFTLANDNPGVTANMLRTVTHVIDNVLGEDGWDRQQFLDMFSQAKPGKVGDRIAVGFTTLPLPRNGGKLPELPLCFVDLRIT